MTGRFQSSLSVDDSLGPKELKRGASIEATGTDYFVLTQSVTTAAAAISIGNCASLRYVEFVNPSDSGATVTATMAPIVMKPGDVALLPVSTTLVTLQGTGACGVPSLGFEI